MVVKVSHSGLIKRNFGPLLVWLLILGLVLTTINAPGMQEMETWRNWLALSVEVDPVYAFHYDPNAYPPGAVSLLFLASKILPITDPSLTIKFLLLIASVLTSVSVGIWRRSWLVAWVSLGVTGFTGVTLGLLDVLFLFPLTLSLWALSRSSYTIFSLFFAVSALIKWQPLIIAPLFAIFVIRKMLERQGWIERSRLLVAAVLPALAVFLTTALVFGLTYIRASLQGATQQDMLSGNALNLNWIFSAIVIGQEGDWGSVSYLYVTEVPSWMPSISRSLFFLVYVILVVFLIRAKNSFTFLAAITTAVVLAYGLLAVGAHENHMILVLPLALYLLSHIPVLQTVSVIAILLPITNIVWFAGLTGQRLDPLMYSAFDPSILGAVLFLVAGGFAIVQCVRFVMGQMTVHSDPAIFQQKEPH